MSIFLEEMFNTNEAVYLHDDENLAFVTFNDTQVDLIQFPVYGGFQYPVIEAIPYPKVAFFGGTCLIKFKGFYFCVIF